MKSIVVILVSLFMSVAFAENHDHHAHQHSKKSSKNTVVTKKFIPTEDLKVRMETILSLAKELKNKKKDEKVVISYGTKIADVVGDIFNTCKLEPDADAAVHPVLGLILEGTEELKKGKYESGHAKIHEALLDYEKFFDHKNWKH